MHVCRFRFSIPLFMLAFSILIAYASSSSYKGHPCGVSTSTNSSSIVRNNAYVALERTTEIRLVNGVAQVSTTGRSLIGRDEAGRTVSVLFPEGQFADAYQHPLAIMISDPALRMRVHENPRTKIAMIFRDTTSARRKHTRNTCGGSSRRPGQANAGFSRAGLTLISTRQLPQRQINGMTAIGTQSVFKPLGGVASPILRIVSETWYSPELHINVLSSSFDPRVGESITEVTDIKASSPDPSYFKLPAGFRVTGVLPVQ
ncbi:MAG: hypothetical protein JWQ49_4019 [Edaphobacter sp.]|nr:hypothetical protein [Edaphobacter sp.]